MIEITLILPIPQNSSYSMHFFLTIHHLISGSLRLFDDTCNLHALINNGLVIKDNSCLCVRYFSVVLIIPCFSFLFKGTETETKLTALSGFPYVCSNDTLTPSMNLIDNVLYFSILYHT